MKNKKIEFAIKENNLTLAKELMSQGIDLSTINEEGENLLMMFDPLKMKSFLDINPFPDIISLMAFLIEKGVDPDHQDNMGMTMLMKYVNADYKLTQFLIKHTSNINLKDNEGKTALIYAISNWDKAVLGNSNYILPYIRLLIENGADINIQMNDGTTPLMIASEKHSDQIVEYFIKHGAKIDQKDNFGETAFIKVFKNTGFGISVQGIADQDLIDTINILLKHGADKNINDKDGNSAFSLAVKNNLNIPIKLLLKYGVDIAKEKIDIQSLFVKSLFHADNFELADFLLKRGIDINGKDIDGNTPLLSALQVQDKCSFSIVKYLFQKGANLNIQNNFGYTPLMLVVRDCLDNEKHVIEYLIDQGADINVVGIAEKSISALTLSIINKKESFYKLLKEKGADPLPALQYLLKNDLYFEKEYFEKMIDDLLTNEINYSVCLNLLQQWSYFDKRIDVDKIDKCIYLLRKLQIRIGEDGCSGFSLGIERALLNPNGIKDIKKMLNGNLHSSTFVTFEHVLRCFIEFPKHNPQKLVKILTNFRKDTPIKYTTHLWDMDFAKDYGNFDGYMAKVQEQWKEIERDLKNLSPNIHRKLYDFLINRSPSNWCSKDGDDISIGWSSLDGLKKWCDERNDPFKFELKKSYSVENKTISTFGDVINLFKQEIQIRNENDILENIFINIEEKLDDEFDGIFEIETIKLKGKSFYTDVEKFKNALVRIFSEIKKRQDFNKIIVEMKEYDDYNYMDLIITQIGSSANRTKEDMEKISNGGDMAEIKKGLINLCDWSVETSYDNESYRIDYLGHIDNNNIESRGFTHRLRFYR